MTARSTYELKRKFRGLAGFTAGILGAVLIGVAALSVGLALSGATINWP